MTAAAKRHPKSPLPLPSSPRRWRPMQASRNCYQPFLTTPAPASLFNLRGYAKPACIPAPCVDGRLLGHDVAGDGPFKQTGGRLPLKASLPPRPLAELAGASTDRHGASLCWRVLSWPNTRSLDTAQACVRCKPVLASSFLAQHSVNRCWR